MIFPGLQREQDGGVIINAGEGRNIQGLKTQRKRDRGFDSVWILVCRKSSTVLYDNICIRLVLNHASPPTNFYIFRYFFVVSNFARTAVVLHLAWMSQGLIKKVIVGWSDSDQISWPLECNKLISLLLFCLFYFVVVVFLRSSTLTSKSKMAALHISESC